MKWANLSRRSLLRRSALGAGALSALGVGAACAKGPGEPYRIAGPPATGAAAAPVTGGTTTATTSMQHAGSGPMSGPGVDIDAAHEAVVKAFPAKTQGLGGQPLAYTMDGEVKVFNLTCGKVRWEVRPGEFKDAFAYNGTLPGPEIRATEGDRIRVVVKNDLPESTSVHWHGLNVPNNQDGVPFITQPPIKPGATYTYEFVVDPSGSHMYHSHLNAMEQVGKGLLGAFIVEPKDKSKYPPFDREYTIVLNDTLLGFTLNGKSFPATQPLTAKLGERVLVRFMNEGLMNHPMHLHGMPMTVVARDGYPQPPFVCDTLDIAPGERWDVIITANSPGTWAFHCHTLSHAEAPSGMFGLVTVLVVEAPRV